MFNKKNVGILFTFISRVTKNSYGNIPFLKWYKFRRLETQKTGKIGCWFFRHLHPPFRSVFLLMAVDNEDIHRRRTRELFPVQSTALLLPSKIPPTAPSCLVHKANQKGIIRPLFTRSSSTILVSSALIHRVSLLYPKCLFRRRELCENCTSLLFGC